jgi:hypothetical protein
MLPCTGRDTSLEVYEHFNHDFLEFQLAGADFSLPTRGPPCRICGKTSSLGRVKKKVFGNEDRPYYMSALSKKRKGRWTFFYMGRYHGVGIQIPEL